MVTEVIILAQGQQKRLGMIHGYKQLLPLPACGDTPIIVRTVRQLVLLGQVVHTTIVAWDELSDAVVNRLISDSARTETAWVSACTTTLTLGDPGNSSLKGIARYFEHRGNVMRQTIPDRQVVLFGDAVYSWACLRAMLGVTDYAFIGTKGLRYDQGELWGVSWVRDHHDAMMSRLRDALLRHPPYDDEYMPGQMRRWISGFHKGHMVDHINALRTRGHYIDIDDYTTDIDMPSQLPLIPGISIAAAADDIAAGLTWSRPTEGDR